MDKKLLTREEYETKLRHEYVGVTDGHLNALDYDPAHGTVLTPIEIDGLTDDEIALEVRRVTLMAVRKEALKNVKTIANAQHLQGQAYALEIMIDKLNKKKERCLEGERQGLDAAINEMKSGLDQITKAMEDSCTLQWESIAIESIRMIPEKTSFSF